MRDIEWTIPKTRVVNMNVRLECPACGFTYGCMDGITKKYCHGVRDCEKYIVSCVPNETFAPKEKFKCASCKKQVQRLPIVYEATPIVGDNQSTAIENQPW